MDGIVNGSSTEPCAPDRVQPALLADSIEVLRLQSRLLGRLDLQKPSRIYFPSRLGWFHLLGQTCILEIGEAPATAACAGDLIIVFPGNEHRVCFGPAEHTVRVEELEDQFESEIMDRGLSDRRSCGSLICGCFKLEKLERTPLYASLPPLIRIEGVRSPAVSYVECILRLMIQEAASNEPGAGLIFNRLLRILLIKAVQGCRSETDHGQHDWRWAIADPQIGRAISLMHDCPQAPWTVAALAERVAMSRSVFSARFTALIGKPPLEYLCDWRMQKASYLLRKTSLELKEVAARIGYDSASAFSKAFARWAGVAPGAYRQTQRLQATGLPSLL